MVTASVRETRLHFSKYLNAAANGEEVVILKHGRPIARLIAIDDSKPAPFPDLSTLRREIAAAHPGEWDRSDAAADVRQDREGRD